MLLIPYHRSIYRSRYQPAPQPAFTPTNITDIEWVNLGLPSGTLWAKDDVDGKMSFMGAQKTYGAHVPSWTNANELCEYCEREWDEATHALVLIGPNGNSISFPCKESNKSYWLNANEQGDPEFGKCFHIGQDKHFWINDKSANSTLYIRLVSHP